MGVLLAPFWSIGTLSCTGSIQGDLRSRAENVRIVRGSDAKKWGPKLTEKEILSPETVKRLAAKIEAYVADMKNQSHS